MAESDNVIPLVRGKRPLGPEDCTICGINRSICMDTDCPGDYAADVPFIGQRRQQGGEHE